MIIIIKCNEALKISLKQRTFKFFSRSSFCLSASYNSIYRIKFLTDIKCLSLQYKQKALLII